MPQDSATFTAKDYNGEPTRVNINIAEVTAAGIDAQVTAIGVLRVAMEALMHGAFRSSYLQDNLYAANPVNDNPDAQRETKWAVNVVDIGGNVYKATEIPMANRTLLPPANDYLFKNGQMIAADTGGEIQDFIDAYEAVARDKLGNAVEVTDIYAVGRNI